ERNQRTLSRASVRGFTLLEIIVVVTIIAILATLIAPRILGNVDKAKIAKAKSEVNSIHQQVSIRLLDMGALTRVPDDFSLEKLTEGTDAVLKKGQLIDPWGHPYILRVPGAEGAPFDIVSYGADGTENGEGYNTDIVSE
ncbi:MAG TPA: type II secretion system protein GspG, partial [Phycisphaerales bacterium]|nr:type II secretion system protein GspG [Phycisphaerales bacterium]